MMASVAAASDAKNEVFLFEKMPSLGKKLLVSGNGRCNVSNTFAKENIKKMYFESASFLYSSFSRFDFDDVEKFFENAGVALKTEDRGRIFPQSDRASDIVNALEHKARSSGVRFYLKTQILEIHLVRSGMEVQVPEKGESDVRDFVGETSEQDSSETTFLLRSSLAAFSVDRVIICCGGKSFPETGSSGDGFALAQKLGHSIVPPRPALAPIFTETKRIASLQGVAIENAGLELMREGEMLTAVQGAVLFSHFGVTGPAPLRLSRFLPEDEDAYRKKQTFLLMDFFPDMKEDTLEKKWMEIVNKTPNVLFRRAMKFLQYEAVWVFLLRVISLDENIYCRDFTKENRRQLLAQCKRFSLPVVKKPSFDKAMVTRGGVHLAEISPKTMESKIVPGLFFAGEVMNVDADSGGFNIQAAFSTGYTAGINAGA